MAWYAQVTFTTVTQVVYVVAGKDADWCHREYGGTWLGASEDGSIRGRFPGVGYVYDYTYDVFHPPQPYPSWTLNTSTWDWDPPVPYPTDGKDYRWDEATLSWVLWYPAGGN